MIGKNLIYLGPQMVLECKISEIKNVIIAGHTKYCQNHKVLPKYQINLKLHS